MNEKRYLNNIRVYLGITNKSLRQLSCECNNYSGYECKKHDWVMLVQRLIEEVDIAIENEE